MIRSSTRGRWWRPVLVPLYFLIMTSWYLYPGSEALVRGRTDVVMSDDTDIAALPYAYSSVTAAVAKDWTRFFHGAILVDQGHPWHDAASWMPWAERGLAVVSRGLLPVEQVSTLLAFVVMTASGLAFFAMGRRSGWSSRVALALASAWAYCPFTLARAQVHSAMVGTYHLPLIVLGLTLVARPRGRRDVVTAAACFLLACTTAHYFVIAAVVMTPIFVPLVICLAKDEPKRALWIRLLVATLPALAFLILNLVFALPSEANIGTQPTFPATGDAAGAALHPFLSRFAAQPLDYFGGDLAVMPAGSRWWWPIDYVNAWIRDALGTGFAHERTQGIRWLLWTLAGVSLFTVSKSRRPLAALFVAFAATSFVLSLAPADLAPYLAPAAWVWRVVPQLRVPARFGIGVHVAVLTLVGLAFGGSGLRGWRRWLALALPLLVIAEYPPLAARIKMSPVRAVFTDLKPRGLCATGVMLPYVNDDWYSVAYYHFKQRLRGTGCTFVNALTEPADVAKLLATLPRPDRDARALDEAAVDRVVALARCAPLGWLAFHEVIPRAWREKLCGRLGWPMRGDFTCVDQNYVPRMNRRPIDCP